MPRRLEGALGPWRGKPCLESSFRDAKSIYTYVKRIYTLSKKENTSRRNRARAEEGLGFSRQTSLHEHRLGKGCLVAYPDGVGFGGHRHWADGRLETVPGNEAYRNVDDVAFLAALADRLAAEYPVDRSRVFAAGISNGAFMCQRLAAERADRISAVACVAGGMAESVAAARPFFQQLRDAIREQVLEFRPDAVFTLAWQGGHPEHDLVHFFTSLAIADLVASGHPRPEFFHLPAYEYTILVAMRFHPLYRGERIRLRLGPRQLDCKLRMIAAYPSQVRLFNDFRKVFRYLVTPLGTISGGARSVEQFLAVEEFGPVPSIDYRRPPHLFDYFTYMFDDFEGVPVTFSRSLRPLVSDFLEQPG